MSIHNEINQQGFKDAYEEAIVNFLFTHSWFDNKLKEALHKFKISVEQYNVLRILQGAHPEVVTVSYIQERMITKNSNVTRLIDKLVKNELVTREICISNRRKMDITITTKGTAELKNMNEVVQEVDNVFKALSEEEAQEFCRILDKIRI